MNLCVIVPAFNHLAEVMVCLNSLQALQVGRVAYHVQDDCSPEVLFPAVIPKSVATATRNETNLGFGGNCNAGARVALAEFPFDVLLFVNQDVFAVDQWSRGWDEALCAPFADPQVGIVGARLLFPTGGVQSAGGTWDAAAQPVHRCLGYSNPNIGEAAEAAEVDWTTGAAIAVRASVFEQLHGFDERYERGYFEDCDLCLRVRGMGYKVVYQPGCTFIHTVGTSGGSPYFTKNALRFKQQWVDSGIVKPGQLRQTVRYW